MIAGIVPKCYFFSKLEFACVHSILFRLSDCCWARTHTVTETSIIGSGICQGKHSMKILLFQDFSCSHKLVLPEKLQSFLSSSKAISLKQPCKGELRDANFPRLLPERSKGRTLLWSSVRPGPKLTSPLSVRDKQSSAMGLAATHPDGWLTTCF